ncbi:hypothetical protein GCM10011516_15310 [Sphingobacterium cellulitidis]|uniref:Uncharacterized protein n=1 Tax=Sphingobacterium cellulitidis TaxID=1768011 RepID=A0A8H9FZ65_9SPHI|nr:hypothetical protein GCM10011516_15310 [Sphingobacterium soli]
MRNLFFRDLNDKYVAPLGLYVGKHISGYKYVTPTGLYVGKHISGYKYVTPLGFENAERR